MTTPILGMTELVAAQSQPEVPVNEALRTLEGTNQISAIARQNAPPGSPAEGDRYIVGNTPSGAWVGHADDVAYYSGGWQYATPLPGWVAYVQGDGLYVFSDLVSPSDWTKFWP